MVQVAPVQQRGGEALSTRVLLVEDDSSLSEVVSLVLTASGMEVTTVANGSEAVARFADEHYDLVVLDIMLPGLDGFGVCEKLRSYSNVPIIMLTARGEAGSVVRGLECGADDYVTKPFESAVLLARVRAVMRRAASDPADANELVQCDLKLDVAGFRAWRGDELIDLSSTEFRLLTELVRHAGQVLTREVLLRRVWHYDYLGDSRLVDMAVKRLRDKIEDNPSEPTRITTVRGAGYRFERCD
jgi:two-component system, OmpR family, response regulator MtrA